MLICSLWGDVVGKLFAEVNCAVSAPSHSTSASLCSCQHACCSRQHSLESHLGMDPSMSRHTRPHDLNGPVHRLTCQMTHVQHKR